VLQILFARLRDGVTRGLGPQTRIVKLKDCSPKKPHQRASRIGLAGSLSCWRAQKQKPRAECRPGEGGGAVLSIQGARLAVYLPNFPSESLTSDFATQKGCWARSKRVFTSPAFCDKLAGDSGGFEHLESDIEAKRQF